MGFSAATLLHALAWHAYGPKPERDDRLDQALMKVWCRARHGVVSNAAYAARSALYPRPRRRGKHIVPELALHLALLTGAATLMGVTTALWPVLMRKSDGVDLPHRLRTMPGLGVMVAERPSGGCMMKELLQQIVEAAPEDAGLKGAGAPTEGAKSKMK